MLRYNKIILILVILLTGASSALANSDNFFSSYSGIVHLKGALVVPTCTMSLGGLKKNIDMGSVKDTNFTGVGDLYVKKQFSLLFDYCYSDISISFLGVTDDNDPMVFKVGETSSPASGIGLAIIDSSGDFLIPNTSYDFTHEIYGHQELIFYARYRSTSIEITGGDANATISIFATYL